MVDEKIIEIAKRARKWTENIAKNDSDPINRSTLRGYCGVASGYLMLLLKKNKYNPSIVMTRTGLITHCFIKLDRVLDVTSTQFKRKPIYTRKTFRSYWRIEQEFKTVTDFIEGQKYWPKDQKFENYLDKVEPELLPIISK